MSSKTLRPGQPARRGTYRCSDCGYELRIEAVSSLPPCPRTSDLAHEQNRWRRRGHVGVAALIAGAAAVGIGFWIHSVGTRRIAAEAGRIAEEARLRSLSGGKSLSRGVRRAQRLAHEWID